MGTNMTLTREVQDWIYSTNTSKWQGDNLCQAMLKCIYAFRNHKTAQQMANIEQPFYLDVCPWTWTYMSGSWLNAGLEKWPWPLICRRGYSLYFLVLIFHIERDKYAWKSTDHWPWSLNLTVDLQACYWLYFDLDVCSGQMTELWP